MGELSTLSENCWFSLDPETSGPLASPETDHPNALKTSETGCTFTSVVDCGDEDMSAATGGFAVPPNVELSLFPADAASAGEGE